MGLCNRASTSKRMLYRRLSHCPSKYINRIMILGIILMWISQSIMVVPVPRELIHFLLHTSVITFILVPHGRQTEGRSRVLPKTGL